MDHCDSLSCSGAVFQGPAQAVSISVTATQVNRMGRFMFNIDIDADIL
jgi:hypothetical protein